MILFRNQSYPKGLCRPKTRLAKLPKQYPADTGRKSRNPEVQRGRESLLRNMQYNQYQSRMDEWTSTSLSVTHNIRFK